MKQLFQNHIINSTIITHNLIYHANWLSSNSIINRNLQDFIDSHSTQIFVQYMPQNTQALIQFIQLICQVNMVATLVKLWLYENQNFYFNFL